MRKQDNPKRNKIRQKKVKDNKLKRVPRPFGITLLAQQANHLKQNINPDLLERIIQYMLSTNIQVKGKKLTISTLADYLNVSNTKIMKAYLEYNSKMSKVMLGTGDRIKGALDFLGLEKILEHQALVSQQLQLLQASQGSSYKPYISSSVNEALKLNLDGIKGMVDISKALSGHNPYQNGLNFQQNNYLNPNLSQTNPAMKAIGINEALNIIHEQGLGTISYNPNDYLHLRKAHDLDSQPEVLATKQAMSNTDGMTLLEGPKTKSNHHESRRSIEENIDEETFLPE
jgi:hypothetical protein